MCVVNTFETTVWKFLDFHYCQSCLLPHQMFLWLIEA